MSDVRTSLTLDMTQSATLPVLGREAPHLRGLPLVGNILDLRRDPIDLMTEVATLGDVAGMRFAHAHYFLVNSPDAIHHVLVDNNRNYTKSPNYGGLKLVLGEGLVTSEGSSGAGSGGSPSLRFIATGSLRSSPRWWTRPTGCSCGGTRGSATSSTCTPR